MADIEVNISSSSTATSSDAFGKTLIISTTKDHAYTEYDIQNDLTLLATYFTADTPVYKLTSLLAQQVPRPKVVAVVGKDLSASTQKPKDLTDFLNTLITTQNDWYRIGLDDQTEALIEPVSDWAESNNKMFYTQFSNTTFTTDFSKKDRTVLAYKANSDRLDFAMLGEAATRVPGSFNWKYRPLQGMKADHIDTITQATIRGKNMNMFLTKFMDNQQATDCMDSGKVASGKYIDEVESKDWIKNRVTQEIAKLLINTEKIPYNDTGAKKIVTAVNIALKDAYVNGLIDDKKDGTPAFSADFTKVANIAQTYKDQRKLVGVTFKYIQLGSIDGVAITGSVTTEL